METDKLKKIWKDLPEALKITLYASSNGFTKLLKKHFSAFTLENDIPKKITGDERIDRFTDFTIAIKNRKTRQYKTYSNEKWKDISFIPQFSWDEKSPHETIEICMRSGSEWYKENDFQQDDNQNGTHKISTVNLCAFDNPEFVGFINKWLNDFSKKGQLLVQFNLDGSIKRKNGKKG